MQLIPDLGPSVQIHRGWTEMVDWVLQVWLILTHPSGKIPAGFSPLQSFLLSDSNLLGPNHSEFHSVVSGLH